MSNCWSHYNQGVGVTENISKGGIFFSFLFSFFFFLLLVFFFLFLNAHVLNLLISIE